MDIRKIVEEYGANNLRIFITEDQQKGFFRNPLGGRHEYVVNLSKDKMEDNYKITFKSIDVLVDPVAPEWTAFSMISKRYYICDFNSLVNRKCDYIEVYALVDEDNKYERIY